MKTKSINLADYITVAEAAAMIGEKGVTPGRVHQLLSAGEFPGRIKFGRESMLLRKEVEKYEPNPRGPKPKKDPL